jgi:hypothetical protein
MPGSRVVVHYRDGNLIKGTTADFFPARDVFHVAPEGGGPAVAVRYGDLKALFFVRELDGSPEPAPRNEFVPDKPVIGRKIRVLFEDGEVMIGTTQGYQPGRPGFFVIPANPQTNTERCFVIAAATREVTLL